MKSWVFSVGLIIAAFPAVATLAAVPDPEPRCHRISVHLRERTPEPTADPSLDALLRSCVNARTKPVTHRRLHVTLAALFHARQASTRWEALRLLEGYRCAGEVACREYFDKLDYELKAQAMVLSSTPALFARAASLRESLDRMGYPTRRIQGTAVDWIAQAYSAWCPPSPVSPGGGALGAFSPTPPWKLGTGFAFEDSLSDLSRRVPEPGSRIDRVEHPDPAAVCGREWSVVLAQHSVRCAREAGDGEIKCAVPAR